MISLESYPIRAADVIDRMLDQEAVLVLPAKGQVKVLNEVGARIWSLADGSRTIRQIINEISQEYQVEAPQAEEDTCEFISTLMKREMMHLASQTLPGLPTRQD